MGCGVSPKQSFMDTYNTLDSAKTVKLEDLSLSKQPYSDILNKLGKNKVLEEFYMKNVEVSKSFM